MNNYKINEINHSIVNYEKEVHKRLYFPFVKQIPHILSVSAAHN